MKIDCSRRWAGEATVEYSNVYVVYVYSLVQFEVECCIPPVGYYTYGGAFLQSTSRSSSVVHYFDV